jgi:ribosomal protein S18 acetylase RimI-like enzyme
VLGKMEEINLREASLGDESVLLEFEQKVLEAERPYNSTIKLVGASYYDLKDLLTNSKSHLLVAEVKGRVVGSGYAQIRASKQSLTHDVHSYLGFMYVVPEYRGRGINKKIVEKLIHWSKSQGISDCYLDVYSENEAAIRAYEKVGFGKSMIEMKLNLE